MNDQYMININLMYMLYLLSIFNYIYNEYIFNTDASFLIKLYMIHYINEHYKIINVSDKINEIDNYKHKNDVLMLQ